MMIKRCRHMAKTKCHLISCPWHPLETIFWLDFDRNLIIKVHLTTSQHCMGWWFDTEQATHHYLYQWWRSLHIDICRGVQQTMFERNLEVRSPLVVFVVGGFAFSQKNNALCVTICNNRVWCVSSGYQHWCPKSLGIALPNMNSSATQIKAQNHLIVILWSCHIIQHLLSHTISVMASHNFYAVHFYCIFLNKNCCPFIQFH